MTTLDDLIVTVHVRSACAGLDPALWYPDSGHTAAAGRAICAACPVLAQCLELALATREKEGCWGGAAQRQRRRLYPVWVQRAHDYRDDCADPKCRWCRTVDAHRACCATGAEGPMQINGPGAQCGFRATYARGCRCGPCSLAISATGGRLRDAGLEIREWWARWFGGNTDRRLLGHAKILASFDVDDHEAAA